MTHPTASRPTPGLLVSVRGPDEVHAAIHGGAGLIDVKEPTRGALGRADDRVIAAVVARVAGRRPVSAALGELIEWDVSSAPISFDLGVSYVKIGLAGCGQRRGWSDLLADVRTRIESASPAKLVAVAYADWRRADAPRPQDVISFALSRHCAAFLFDTWQKDGSSLLDWMTVTELTAICGRFRAAGVTVALSGSLGAWQLRRLLPAGPDWFGVRGSVCAADGRTGTLDGELVRNLVAVLTGPPDARIPESPNISPSTEESP